MRLDIQAVLGDIVIVNGSQVFPSGSPPPPPPPPPPPQGGLGTKSNPYAMPNTKSIYSIPQGGEIWFKIEPPQPMLVSFSAIAWNYDQEKAVSMRDIVLEVYSVNKGTGVETPKLNSNLCDLGDRCQAYVMPGGKVITQVDTYYLIRLSETGLASAPVAVWW